MKAADATTGLTPLHEARRIVLDAARPLGLEKVSILDTLGRVLGDVIREQDGQAVFGQIEAIRRASVAYHREPTGKSAKAPATKTPAKRPAKATAAAKKPSAKSPTKATPTPKKRPSTSPAKPGP